MIRTRDPAEMSAAERVAALADLLAAGYLRHLARQDAPFRGTSPLAISTDVEAPFGAVADSLPPTSEPRA